MIKIIKIKNFILYINRFFINMLNLIIKKCYKFLFYSYKITNN